MTKRFVGRSARKTRQLHPPRRLNLERLDERLMLSVAPATTNNDAYAVTPNIPLMISAPGVLTNDTDTEMDTLTAVLPTQPAHGTLTFNANGSFTYTPNMGYTGIDAFSYRAFDGTSNSQRASVTLTVSASGPPAAPVLDLNGGDAGANFAAAFVEDGGPVAIVDANATLSDADSTNLTSLVVTITNLADAALESLDADVSMTPGIAKSYAAGTLTLSGSASVATYLQVLKTVTFDNASQNPGTTPRNVSFVASDGAHSSNVAVSTVSISTSNDAPVAVADGDYNVNQDQTLTVNAAAGVLANDDDPDNDPLTAVLVDDVQFGTLTLNSDGSFSYLPDSGYTGPDSFTYQASDGLLMSEVTAVTLQVVEGENAPPTAVNDSYMIPEDGVLSIAAEMGVLDGDTDPDGDPLTAELVMGLGPLNGTLVFNPDGSFAYTPNLNFHGVDGFSYRATDGELFSAVAAVTIEVTSVNDAPLADNDSYMMLEDGVLTVTAGMGVLNGDSDVDGDSLTATLIADAANGTLTLNSDGSFTYVPDLNFNGEDSFTYVANDSTENSLVAVVTITVDSVNDLPLSHNDLYSVAEDATLTRSAGSGVLANDFDIQGDSLTATLVTDAANGTLTLNADGSFTYVPDADFNGVDTFVYVANDGSEDSSPTTVTIAVNPVNDAPAAGVDSYEISINTMLTGSVLDNDSDVEGVSLTAVYLFGPFHGTLNFNVDGTFEYTPTLNYAGPDSFYYQANDGEADSNVIQVQIDVTENTANTAPVAEDDAYSVDEDGALDIPAPGVIGNDFDNEGDSLTAELVSPPAHGVLMGNPDGSFVYVPDENYFGEDSFTYFLNDGDLDSNVATVTITVNSVNDVPVGVNDPDYVVDEDNMLIVAATGVLGNDTDVEGDLLTATLVTDVTNGTLTLNSDGSFTYTPDADFNGVDTFVYVANDGLDDSGPTTVTITVNSVNDVPVGVNDPDYVVDEDNTLTVAATGVLSNDTDVEGDSLTATLVTDVTNGTLTLNSDGSFTYTPDADFNGVDTFVYVANDSLDDSGPTTVTITVNSVNDVPVGVNDLDYMVDEDNTLTVAATGVLSNDTDVEGDSLTATLLTDVTNGTLTLNSDGSFTYTPDADFNGVDTFVYVANDGSDDSGPTTVTITVNSVNDVPVGVNDPDYVVDEDNTLTVAAAGVLSNDTDVEGDSLTATLVTDVTNGTLTLSSDGSFTYTPDADFNGVDTFVYVANDGLDDSDPTTVTITVNSVNDVPVGVNDPDYVVDEDNMLIVAATGVLSNDTDVEGDSLTATLVTDVTNGTLTLNSDGSFTYTPDADFNGVDTFVYVANDSLDDSGPTTVTITVNSVNDVPVGVNDLDYMVDEDNTLTVAATGVLSNDTDVEGDSLTATLVTDVTNGTLTLNSDGSFTYTPDADFNGVDTFVYVANDSLDDSGPTTVTITVNSVNDVPVGVNDLDYMVDEDNTLTVAATGVLSNDTDVEGDSLTATLLTDVTNGTLTLNSDGSFTYTPDADFNGVDTFVYVANDGSDDSGPTTVTITVNPVNDVPVGVNDPDYVVDEDNTLTVLAAGVLSNDTDVEGDLLTATLVTDVTNGTLTLNSDGSFTYTPDADFNGVDTFVYVANDGSDDSGPTTVTITVNPVNDAPLASDDPDYVVDEDNTLTVPAAGVLSNDTDVEGDLLTATLVTDVTNGTLTLNSDGSFTYTPDADFNGVDSFTYVANDGAADSLTATVSITVAAVNNAPVADDESFSIGQSNILTEPAPGVLDGDTDIEGSSLTAVLVGMPAHGNVTLAADGSFVYDPNNGYSGPDSFTYQASDGSALSNVATVSINVTTGNTRPEALNDSYNAISGVPLVIGAPGVMANDFDADGDAITADLKTGPGNGSVTLNADGSFTYTSDPGFTGEDAFTYRVSDGPLKSFTAAVTILVGSAPMLLLTAAVDGLVDGLPALSEDEVSPLVVEGVLRWFAAAPQLHPTDHPSQFDVSIVDLPGATLGLATSGRIYIDVNAAGRGWFIDSTPGTDEEFEDGNAPEGSPAAGRVDLLTVLMHEMGHLLELHHSEISDNDLLSLDLSPGMRRNPIDAVDDVFGGDDWGL